MLKRKVFILSDLLFICLNCVLFIYFYEFPPFKFSFFPRNPKRNEMTTEFRFVFQIYQLSSSDPAVFQFSVFGFCKQKMKIFVYFFFFVSSFHFGLSCPEVCQCSFDTAHCFLKSEDVWFPLPENLLIWTFTGKIGAKMRSIIRSKNVHVILENDECHDLVMCK